MTAKRPPWGRAAGLLAGSIVTFIGVWQHLDPDELLRRIVVASSAIAFLTHITLSILTKISQPYELADDEPY